MKKLCKFTDEKGYTYNNTLWGEGVTHTASGEGKLCNDGWIHYYDDPLLAVIFNPIHANFTNPILWEVEVKGKTRKDSGVKFGATSVTTIHPIPIPQITLKQKIRFAILCVLEVYHEAYYVDWARKWLSGEDRSEAAAWTAAEAAETAARAAWTAAEAAETAARAAETDLSTLIRKAIGEEEG